MVKDCGIVLQRTQDAYDYGWVWNEFQRSVMSSDWCLFSRQILLSTLHQYVGMWGSGIMVSSIVILYVLPIMENSLQSTVGSNYIQQSPQRIAKIADFPLKVSLTGQYTIIEPKFSTLSKHCCYHHENWVTNSVFHIKLVIFATEKAIRECKVYSFLGISVIKQIP